MRSESALALAVLCLFALCAAAAAGSTDIADSVRLSLNPASGRVAEVVLGASSVTDPKVSGGFSYRIGNTGPFRPLLGKVLGQELQASDGDLALRATIVPKADMTRIDGRITKPGKDVDLGIQLRFRLPVDATGWTYWEDLRRSRTITNASERYAFEGPVKYPRPRQMAYYPLLALSPKGQPSGLCLAVPMDSPNVFRLAYQQGEGLYVDFDLGLHSAQQGGPHADFSLVVYSFSSPWGMRAALQGYYERFPQLFVKRVPAVREGVWFFDVNREAVGNPADFNLAFDEHARSRWAWDAEHGIYSMEYSEPWNYYDEWYPHGSPGPHPQPSYDEMIAHLKKGLASSDAAVRDGSKAAFASAVVGRDGKLSTDLRYWAVGPYWYTIFHTIVHPDLADGMQNWMMAHEFRPALEDSTKAGVPLRGWYLDSVNLSGSDEDYSTAHFALPGVRLTADWEEGRATLLGWLADYRWTERFGETLHAEGKVLLGNGIAWGLDEAGPFYPHLFDVLGIESALKRYDGNGKPRPVDYVDGGILLSRALMYRKPICTLYYDDQDSYDFNWRHSLFYGIHDGPHSVWTDPKRIEAYRPIARHYVPIVRQLVAAGWCPITYARSGEVWLERFGGEKSGPLFITVRNPGASATACAIELDLSATGLNGSVSATAREMISSEETPVALTGKTARISTTVASEDTKVFRFDFTGEGRE